MTFLTTLLSLFLSAPAHLEHASARVRAELSLISIESVREQSLSTGVLTCGGPPDTMSVFVAPHDFTDDLEAQWKSRSLSIGVGAGGRR
jgi:hypothetical protein